MQADIEQILIPRYRIAKRVSELAQQITRDLLAEADSSDTPAEITLVPILTGSMIFVADLIRQLPIRMQIRLVSVTSYPGRAVASRGPRIEPGLGNLPESLAGLHVLLIDDILDSGRTLRRVSDLIQSKQPASVRTCVLLRKQRPEAMTTPVDYVAFDIPDRFVVGYGLDFDDYYRNLPDIVTLHPSVIEGSAEPTQMRTDEHE